MKTSSQKPFLPKLAKYSAISVTVLSLASPLMAIERPVPAEQPVEKKVAPIPLKPGAPNIVDAPEKADAITEKLTYLGVYGVPINETLSHHLKLEKGLGIELELVAPGSPASKAALKRRDIIIKIADKNISSMDDISKVVTSKKARDIVEIQLISEGNKVTKQVTLAERTAPKRVRQIQPRLEQDLGRFPNQDMLKMGLPKELLEQFPKKDRERLMQLFEGGAFENNIDNLKKQFGELNEFIPEVQEPNLKMNTKGTFQSRVKMLDQHGSITLESTNDGKVIELKDKQGKVQYRGPYNNDIDKASIPDNLRSRVDNLKIDNKTKLFNQPKFNIKPKLSN